MISASSPRFPHSRQDWPQSGQVGHGQSVRSVAGQDSFGKSSANAWAGPDRLQRQTGVRFSGAPTQSFLQQSIKQGKAFFPGLWKEFSEWAPKQKILLADGLEKLLNKVRKAVASLMMLVSVAVPLPKWLYTRLERDYFFSPRKVMGLKFRNDTKLNEEVIPVAFQLAPKTENLDLLQSFYLPAKEQGKPTIVFFHGRDTNLGHLEDLFKEAKDKGYGFFAYDYPGFGKSDGVPREDWLKQSGEAACKFLASDGYTNGHGVPYKDQVLMGYSLGGGVASHVAEQFGKSKFNLAGKDNMPRGLILVNTFTSIPESFKETLKGQRQGWRKIVAKAMKPERIGVTFNSKAAVKDVQFPVRAFSNPDDNVIPYELCQQLANAAPKGLGRWYQIGGKGHNIKGEQLGDIIKELSRGAETMLKPSANHLPAAVKVN